MATNWYVRSRPTATRTASHSYVLGDKIVSTSSTQFLGICFECTTAGTSGSGGEPAWNTTIGGTTADSGVTWTTRGAAGIWLANKTWVVGDRVVRVSDSTNGNYNSNSSNVVWDCTTGGAGGGTEPSWPTNPTIGTTTQADSSATWTARAATSWDNCHPYLGALVGTGPTGAAPQAGDSIYVSKTHNEKLNTGSVNQRIVVNGNVTNGGAIKILSIDDTGMPTSGFTLTSGAIVEVNTGISFSDISLEGLAYFWGITFKNGSRHIFVGGTTISSIWLENCMLWLNSSNSAGVIIGMNGTSVHEAVLNNTQVKFGAAAQCVVPYSGSFVKWRNTSPAVALGTSPTKLFSQSIASEMGGAWECTNLDFSNLTGGGSTAIMDAGNIMTSPVKFIFRDCKLPSSFAFAGSPSTYRGGAYIAEFINCDSGSTNYVYHREAPFGTIDQETTLVRSGGASDGTTTISWKAVSRANSVSNGGFPFGLQLPPIVVWNDTSGSSKTATVEILADTSANLNDDDIWMEVDYLVDSGDPLGATVSTAKASVVASNSALSAGVGTGSWTTTGMSHPNSMKMSKAFTPQQKGPVIVRVYLGKANQTVYVDPVVTIS